MDIIGNGVDIIKNSRINNSLKIKGFLNRIFTEKEIQQGRKIRNKTNFYAKRFAAKEAFVKAIGTGFSSDIKLSKTLGSKCIEIHTGKISNQIKQKKNYSRELNKIKKCATYAKNIGLEVHAGHGMDYKTTKILNKIKQIEEFNIGHFIIGESIFFGLKNVIKKFKKICK